VLIAVRSVGIDMTAFAVVGGALGIGLGFGFQKAVSNLISGVILLIDKSIKPGDVISVSGTYGWVTTLGGRYVAAMPGFQSFGERVDRRADLYSLSLAAIFGLTGRSPFAGLSVPAVLARQAAGDLPDLRTLRPEVPEGVLRVLKRGAARDPANRFGSAQEYLQELERALRQWRDRPWRWIGHLFGAGR